MDKVIFRHGSCAALVALAFTGCGGHPASQPVSPGIAAPEGTELATPMASAPGASDPLDRGPVAIPVAINDELSVRALAPGVFIITHAVPWPANSLVVEMDDGTLVLVDTPYTPEATDALLAWLRQRYGERPLVAINSHFHYDAAGGNQALLRAGAHVHASDRTVAALAEREQAMRAQVLDWLESRPEQARHFRDLAVAHPDRIFPAEQGLQLTFGADTVRVIYPGPAHAPDNVVVYFPERRLLFGGCMILAQDRMGNRADADMASWLPALERLRALEFDHIIPGHGDRTDPALLDLTRTVIESVLRDDQK